MASEWLDLAPVVRQLDLGDMRPSWDGWWRLRCPVCHRPLPSGLLVDQTLRLARHLVEVHPYESALLASLLAQERARAHGGG